MNCVSIVRKFTVNDNNYIANCLKSIANPTGFLIEWLFCLSLFITTLFQLTLTQPQTKRSLISNYISWYALQLFFLFFSAWRLYNVSLDTLFVNHCKGKGVTNKYQKWNSKVFALFPVKYELQQSGCTVPRIV